MTVVHKATVAKAAGGDPLTYVMSDGSIDRYGDTVEPKGWNLVNFKKNPIALFGHDSKFIVGHWRNVRIEGDKLLGRLELLREGISDRLDEIRAAVEAGVLRAVSVGFHPIEAEPREGGVHYIKSELVECSLVAVPANPNALAIAKSLNLSADATALIFGESADEISGIKRRGITGESAAISPSERPMKMSLSQQIEAAQTRLVDLTDLREQHIAKFADGVEMDDQALTALEEYNTKLANQQRTVKALKGSEQEAAQRSEPVTKGGTALEVSGRRPFAAPAQKIAPRDLYIRSMVVGLLSHLTRQAPAEIIRERYEDHPDTRTVFDMVTRAASAPATTSTANWASQLFQTVNADFLETLAPAAIYPRLAALGQRYTFGRNGTVSIPSWDTTPTVAGGFVLEGAAIPVKQAALTSVTLGPKKMAVITTFTREIAEHSTPAIEGLLRQKINMDTATALDTVLLDATAVSTTRPAGLRNGVAELTATAGGLFAALVGDIKAHIGTIAAATAGQLTRPVILLNPAQAIAVGMTQNAGGDFPFGNVGLEGGTIQGIPVIVSSTVTAGMMITVDAAWFATAAGDEPRFDVSDQATLHMEDTSPVAIGTVGTPNVVAAPVRSLFQTDSLALRMILPMNWTKVRSGIVQWSSAVTW